jgi:hypothetical protein
VDKSRHCSLIYEKVLQIHKPTDFIQEASTHGEITYMIHAMHYETDLKTGYHNYVRGSFHRSPHCYRTIKYVKLKRLEDVDASWREHVQTRYCTPIPEKPFPLLSLPPELRNWVYKLVSLGLRMSGAETGLIILRRYTETLQCDFDPSKLPL